MVVLENVGRSVRFDRHIDQLFRRNRREIEISLRADITVVELEADRNRELQHAK